MLDPAGRFVARVDFYWDEYGVVGEADGNVKYETRQALVDERRRQLSLEALGLTVVRWEWRDLWCFDEVVERLRIAFAVGNGRRLARRWVAAPAD